MNSARRFVGAVLLCVAIAGCSGDDEQVAAPRETIDLREPIEATDDVASGDSATSTTLSEPSEPAEPVDLGEPTEATVDDASGDSATSTTSVAPTEPIVIVDEPATRGPVNPTIDASNWVARTSMSSTFVELVWSPLDGADTYTLYRLPTASADYDAIGSGLIEGADEVYEGPEFGYIDTGVPVGEFLTYVLVADVDGALTTPRWTEALTVDDVTPPAPITGLTATETNDGVLLAWEPSPDDVEFANYSVSILEDDDRLTYIGGGSDVGQVSFIDDESFTGTRTYVVAAVDFHNNVSEPAQIAVTR